ncbi:MAG: type VII toxin-antitoxin system HepT family RNase toxin [Planctomycetota bacterium]|jgi:uncharacterized protein YutE (UPF0331/DUF86 family)
MDNGVVANKLESLRRCVVRIESKVPDSAEALKKDVDCQDILSINLERAVQVCVDISSHIVATTELPAPATMGEGFDQLAELGVISSELAVRMRKAVGFRNLSVHAYDEIDWEIVFSIVTKHLSDFTAYARAIVEHTS